MSTLFSCCVHQKDVAGSKGKTPGQGIEGDETPSEAVTLLDVQ